MADRKISDLTALTTPASGDYLPIVDISEAAAASKNKRVTVQSLFQGIPVNVGIGTSSPSGKLNILQDSTANTTPAIRITGSAGDPTNYFLDVVPIFNGSTVDYRWDLKSVSTNTALLYLSGAGRVGIGTNTPTAGYLLDCRGNVKFGSPSTAGIYLGVDANIPFVQGFDSGATYNQLKFLVGGSEAVRIDSSGRLLVGTSTSLNTKYNTSSFQPGLQSAATFGTVGFYRFSNNADGSTLVLSKSRSDTLGTQAIVSNGDTIGYLGFTGSDGSEFQTGATITAQVDGTPGADDMPGRLVFSTTADGASSPTERMRIMSNGYLAVGTTDGNPGGNNVAGFVVEGSVGSFQASRLGNKCADFNRGTNDGAIVNLRQDGVVEGTISVSGGTISYNPFLGSHWGRLQDGSKLDIPIGTILETIDKLIEWKVVAFEVSGEQKLAAYNGSAKVGDTVQVDYEGISYVGIVQNEEENPSDLNKHVCVKINDTAASKAVFGVFLGWDEDVPENMVNTWNDMYCAAVGNYFVRIKAGEVIAIGDLVEADGNGCGVVQDDDIIRTKTVAKITSTIPQVTYDDGSFLVTCVLCCG